MKKKVDNIKEQLTNTPRYTANVGQLRGSRPGACFAKSFPEDHQCHLQTGTTRILLLSHSRMRGLHLPRQKMCTVRSEEPGNRISLAQPPATSCPSGISLLVDMLLARTRCRRAQVLVSTNWNKHFLDLHVCHSPRSTPKVLDEREASFQSSRPTKGSQCLVYIDCSGCHRNTGRFASHG